MDKQISKKQRDLLLRAWDHAVRGRFDHDECSVPDYQVRLDALSDAADCLGIPFMYPGLVAQGF